MSTCQGSYVFFFKQKTAYEMRIGDWSSDVCSSDLPLRAMVHELLDSGASERIHFWYGARNLQEAPYVGEMAELAERHPNFSWHLVLSEEAEHGAGLINGLVHEATHDALLHDHPDIHSCEFYLCGPDRKSTRLNSSH